MMGIDSCGMLISAVHHEGEEEKLHLLTIIGMVAEVLEKKQAVL